MNTTGFSPLDIADFGIVMLIKPVDTFSLVTARDTSIDVTDSFFAIARLEI
jgi:hypothetical protein